MDEKDPIEEKFRSAFADFEKEPPAGAWESLRAELHPVPLPVPAGLWQKFLTVSWLADRSFTFYLSLSLTAVLLSFSVFYFGSFNRREIRGHAYAGTARLQGGTAVLFEVSEKSMPWDSATYYRSAVIDRLGHFRFSRVAAGNYLLRITPERKPEGGQDYMATWYDQRESSDSCRLIRIGKSDETVEVRLKKATR
jgi:hypothetical protein